MPFGHGPGGPMGGPMHGGGGPMGGPMRGGFGGGPMGPPPRRRGFGCCLMPFVLIGAVIATVLIILL